MSDCFIVAVIDYQILFRLEQVYFVGALDLAKLLDAENVAGLEPALRDGGVDALALGLAIE